MRFRVIPAPIRTSRCCPGTSSSCRRPCSNGAAVIPRPHSHSASGEEMAETKPSSELAPHLDSCRWHIRDGAWLLTDPSTAALRRNLQVVALGGGTGLPVVLRGLKAELFPNGPAWVRTMDPRRLTAIVTVAEGGGSP